MNSFLLSLAALLVLALSAAFIGPHFVDWNTYRDVFEAQASRLVGRAVEVQGNVRLTVLPAPVLRFEQVRIADAQGSFETPFAQARSFTVWLSMPPLLRGAVEAREIDLEQPVLNLRLDEQGGGNWRDLGRAGAELPFVPSTVALESVQIKNGTITIERGSAAAPVTLENVEGELSARSLQGPFKVDSAFTVGGKAWELRFSTGRQEAEGGTRLKALLHDVELQQSYALDGTLADFASAPSFNGHLLARFAPEGGQLSEEAKPVFEAAQDAALEIKAEMAAELTQATLDNIEATLRHGDRPHTLGGRLHADWRDGLVAEADLTGRWFDLDALAGLPKAEPPGRVLASLAERLFGQAALVREGGLRLSLEQAVLGGDVIKGLRLDVSRDGDRLHVNKLAGETPGENFVELSGVLDVNDAPVFTGRAAVEGKRLSRLLRWSGAQVAALAGTEAGDYSVEAQVSFATGGFAFDEVRGDVLGTAFSGSLHYRTDPRPEFILAFDSERLDLERLFGSEATFGTLRTLFLSAGEADDAAQEQNKTPWLERADAKIDLDIGSVRLPKLGETSLKAALQVDDGNLMVEEVHLATLSSLDVKAQGKLNAVARRPDGSLTLQIKAAAAAGLEGFARFLELPESMTPTARLQALSPVDVAVKLESKGRSDRLLEATMFGSVGGSTVRARLGFKGDLLELAAGTVELEAAASNDDGRMLLAQLFPRLSPAELERFEAGHGALMLAAKGVPGQGLEAEARLDTAGLRWHFDGEAEIAAPVVNFSGSAALSAKTAASVMALAGLGLGDASGATGVELTARVAKSGQTYDVTGLKGKVAGHDIQGKLQIDRQGAKPQVNAIVAVSEASLPHLLGPFIDWRGTAGADTLLADAIAGGSDFWTDKRFAAALLDTFGGELVLTAQRLRLAEDLVVEDATIEAEMTDGAMTVQTIKGRLFGGTFEASGQLAKRGGGVAVTAKAAGQDIKLEAATARPGAKPLARGTADFDISVVGEGLTPRGLVAGLTGDGNLVLAKGRIDGLSPDALSVFSDTRQAAASAKDLAKRVAARFAKANFAFQPVTVPFGVRNGTIRFKREALISAEGAATVSSYFELASLKLDSEWVLASGKAGGTEAVPEVTVVFSGPLSEFGEMTPEINAQALEHYITMRRLEQDVERLEKLDVSGGRGAAATPPLPRRLPVSPAAPTQGNSMARRTQPVQPSSSGERERAGAPATTNSVSPSPAAQPDRPSSTSSTGIAPAQPPSNSEAVVSAPLPPLPSPTPAPPVTSSSTRRSPATSAASAASPPGEVLPWLTDTQPDPRRNADGRATGGLPVTEDDGTITNNAIARDPAAAAGAQGTVRRDGVPWQVEVFRQSPN